MTALIMLLFTLCAAGFITYGVVMSICPEIGFWRGLRYVVQNWRDGA